MGQMERDQLTRAGGSVDLEEQERKLPKSERIRALLVELQDFEGAVLILHDRPESFKEFTKGENPILTTFQDTTQGYHFQRIHSQLFINTLIDAKMTLITFIHKVKSGPKKGNWRYIYIFSKDRERAQEAYAQNRDLDRFLTNPVRQLCGPTVSEIPSTYELMLSGEDTDYKSTGSIFARHGVHFSGSSKIKTRDFFNEDCPVPVFKWKDKHRFPREEEQELEEYIKKRAAELGMGRAAMAVTS